MAMHPFASPQERDGGVGLGRPGSQWRSSAGLSRFYLAVNVTPLGYKKRDMAGKTKGACGGLRRPLFLATGWLFT